MTKGKKKFRMILIDPEKHTVENIQCAEGELEKFVEAPLLEMFRIAEHVGQYDYGTVDDQGLARGEPIFAFKFKRSADPIAGKCVIYGAEKYGGATCDAMMPLAFVQSEIEWLGLIIPHVEWVQTKRGGTAKVTWRPAP
jgi:hypothetical protein